MTTTTAPGWLGVRPDSVLSWTFLLFVASAFALPSGPAYALVFYLLVLPACLIAARRLASGLDAGAVLALALVVWSGLTLLWGHDDHHRSARFAVDSAMTLVFLFAMLGGLATAAQRRRLGSVLIWAGAANAVLSVALGHFFPLPTERLHGWGVTSHPILGASVMSMAFLTALTRMLTERRHRLAHLGAGAAMTVFLLMTESRGPLLAVLVATLFLCLQGPWRWRALGAMAALGLLWALLPASVRHHQEAAMVSRGSSHRLQIWSRTLELIGQRPLFGHGLAANLDLPGITFPHDLYLSVLFYSGVVGFVLFALLGFWVSLALWRAARSAEWLWMAALWVDALLSGLTDLGQITKGPGPMWFIFWLPVGLVLATGERPSFLRKKAFLSGGSPGARDSGVRSFLVPFLKKYCRLTPPATAEPPLGQAKR